MQYASKTKKLATFPDENSTRVSLSYKKQKTLTISMSIQPPIGNQSSVRITFTKIEDS